MNELLLTVRIANEQDVVMVRQRADQIASELGFSRSDATRIATAVSEIARNALQYAGGGRAEFKVVSEARGEKLEIYVSDRGKGITEVDRILSGTFRSGSGLGLGIVGSKRLMDELDIDTSEDGTTIRMAQWLPHDAPAVTREGLDEIVTELTRGRPRSPIEEIQRQNQELLSVLDRERAAREEAEAATQSRDDFFALLSHELRTPLTSIIGWADFLKASNLGEDERTAVRSIRQSGEALSNLISQLLEVSRIQMGKVVLDLEKIDLAEVVADTAEMLRPAAASKRIALETATPVQPLAMDGDKGRLRQIVWNLLSNAIKFTPEEGTVRVSVRRLDGHAEIVVSDTGVGIDREILPRIFEKLQQAEDRQSFEGLGLGLFLVKHYADLHEGQVRAESAGRNEGAVFTVTLPLEH